MSLNYQFDKKRVLVTGGSGFLGSHLCRRLLSEDCQVICLDNLYCSSFDNVSGLTNDKRFSFIRHDITEPISVFADEIYNLACPASPVHYQRYPIHTFKTSILGALNVLELARKTNARVFQASTSEVYGDPAVHPQIETYWGNVNPIGIRSCYDEGKRGAETLFFDYHRQYGVEIKVVRIFNTYGPQMHPADGRVVSNFIIQALRNKPLTIYGDGSQTRSFCYVSDLIEGFVRMMESNKECIGPVNLGNPTEFNIRTLAEMVVEMTGSHSKLSYKDLPSDDPKVRRPNIQKAKELLGWTPKVSLEEGLQKTIPYFRNVFMLQ